MAKLLDVEGIGPVNADKLKMAGVGSTESLLSMGGTAAGRKDLAAKSGVSEKLILEWVNHADLVRVKGVGSEFSDLLEEAGVDTVKELRNRNPENLHQAIVAANAEKKLVRRVPSLKEVTAWVAAAKELEPLVTY